MRAVTQSVVCDRVRAQVSLELDSELSHLERRMMDAHLARCSDCRSFQADIGDFTRELREAEPERLVHPIEISRLRRSSIGRLQVGVAAGVAVAILGVAATLSGSRASGDAVIASVGKPSRFETSAQLTREVNQVVAAGRAYGQPGPTIAI